MICAKTPKIIGAFVLFGLFTGCVTADRNTSTETRTTTSSTMVTAETSDTGICGNRSAEQCFLFGETFVSEERQTKNYKIASEFYLKASEMGHSPADIALGRLYSSPFNEMLDLKKALYHMKRAANNMETEAFYGMGNLLASASYPEIQNLDEAETWYLKAAKKEHFVATFSLAYLYQNPDWNKRNLQKSFAFFLISTAFRDKKKDVIYGAGPEEHMAILRKYLSPQQQLEAQNWAIKWMAINT